MVSNRLKVVIMSANSEQLKIQVHDVWYVTGSKVYTTNRTEDNILLFITIKTSDQNTIFTDFMGFFSLKMPVWANF